MTTFNPTEPPALLLARVAYPEYPPESWQEGPDCAWTDQHKRDHGVVWFRPDSLDDLALVERRVVEAGHGFDLSEALDKALPVGRSWWELRFATAQQRTAALLSFFAAHPAVYEELTTHE